MLEASSHSSSIRQQDQRDMFSWEAVSWFFEARRLDRIPAGGGHGRAASEWEVTREAGRAKPCGTVVLPEVARVAIHSNNFCSSAYLT